MEWNGMEWNGMEWNGMTSPDKHGMDLASGPETPDEPAFRAYPANTDAPQRSGRPFGAAAQQ